MLSRFCTPTHYPADGEYAQLKIVCELYDIPIMHVGEGFVYGDAKYIITHKLLYVTLNNKVERLSYLMESL